MRKAITLLLLLTACISTTFAQKAKDYEYIGLQNFPMSAESGKVQYEGVIEADSMSAQDLYDAALLWITKNYANKNAISKQEPGAFISGSSGVSTPDGNLTKFDFMLQFKDGRYRYVLNNFVILWSSGSSALETFFPEKVKGRTAMLHDKRMQQMHAAYDAEVIKLAAIGKKKEDW